MKGTVIRTRYRYGLAALLILLIEVAIALWIRDDFVRPHLGDTLAVMLVYCGLRWVLPIGRVGAVAAAFAIACGIEFGQLFGLVDVVGLGRYRVARIVLGTGFDPRDFIAYAAGAAVILLAGAVWDRRRA